MSQEFLARILEQKAREVEQMKLEQIQPLRQTYRLAEFLKNHQDRLQVIAEVKKASPSLGDINLDVDIVQQAQTYEANGAVMISVLSKILPSSAGLRSRLMPKASRTSAEPDLEEIERLPCFAI